jgi:cytochrome c oxidase subunit 2
VTAVRAVLVFAMALMLADCAGWQSIMDVHGASAVHIKQLIVFICGVCAIIWFAVVLVLARGLSRGMNERDNLLQLDTGRERRMKHTIIAAMIGTVAVITVFTIASFYTTRSLSLTNDEDIVIRVRGLQWWWEFKYLKPDGQRTFTTANEIHIPTGKDVRIQLEGGDVIHSFWVPSLAGKQDLVPGRLNELTLHADRAGIYRGQCAEFCGLQHAHMAFFVIAEPEATFKTWLEAQHQDGNQSDDPEAQHGRAVFESKACNACHTVRGTLAQGTNGPDLTHVSSRRTIASGLLETNRGSFAAWIADPQTIKPGNNMPMVPLQADELRAVSAYMMSLK